MRMFIIRSKSNTDKSIGLVSIYQQATTCTQSLKFVTRRELQDLSGADLEYLVDNYLFEYSKTNRLIQYLH